MLMTANVILPAAKNNNNNFVLYIFFNSVVFMFTFTCFFVVGYCSYVNINS